MTVRFPTRPSVLASVSTGICMFCRKNCDTKKYWKSADQSVRPYTKLEQN